MVKAAQEITNIALAVEETITTPAPGLGHGHIADIVAMTVFILSTFHIAL